MTDDRSLERAARSWLEEGPTRAPDRPVEAALRAIDTTPQERAFRIPWGLGSPNPATRLAAIILVVIVAAGAASIVLRPSSNVGGPASPSPTSGPPSPSPTVAPTAPPSSSATRPPGLATVAPLVPATPLPDPSGANLPADLIGRVYVSDPSEVQGTQVTHMTLRAADDPNCMAMYGGRSTCFTVLWEPNYPKHVTDPGVRGSARIVDGKLVLGWALAPFALECEGTSSTFAIGAGGATLTVVGPPACAYELFRQV